MKKKSRTVRSTLDQAVKRKPTKKKRDEIAALAELPDDQIDTSDIPEITSTSGWIRNPFYRPVTRSMNALERALSAARR